MTDNEILDLAASAGITAVCCRHGGTYRDGVDTLKLLAEKVIEKFLKDSGQYVTNDASREVAIAQAVAAERAASAQQDQASTEALAQAVTQALYQAWQLGQTYWAQVDSEQMPEWKKADETRAKFQRLVSEVRSIVLAGKVAAPEAAKPAPKTPEITDVMMFAAWHASSDGRFGDQAAPGAPQ